MQSTPRRLNVKVIVSTPTTFGSSPIRQPSDESEPLPVNLLFNKYKGRENRNISSYSGPTILRTPSLTQLSSSGQHYKPEAPDLSSYLIRAHQ